MPRHLPTSPSQSDPVHASARGEAEAAAKAAFHLRLRARGVRDLAVLRAFEIVPRAFFVPHVPAALAARDLPLPLPCGQTSQEPWMSALAVEALDTAPGQRVLEIGSGSGYVTAVLAELAGQVVGLERFASLAAAAQAKLRALGIDHASVIFGDGLALPADLGTFDRILVHACLPEVPTAIRQRLAPGGRLVAATPGQDDRTLGQALTLWSEGAAPVTLCPCRLAPLVQGLAAAL